MVKTLERNVGRGHFNRAVASVTAVDEALCGSSLLAGGLLSCRPLHLRETPVVRYTDMESLIKERLKPDPHKDTREALRALQTAPVLRDEFTLMNDATLRCICAFLGDRLRDLLQIGSVCRRLRSMVIALTPSSVVLVPEMIPLASLSNHAVVDSLCALFAPYKRGQFVQRLHLVDSKYASSLPVSTTLPVCSRHVYPSLVKMLPSLMYLDLRGVRWDCHSCPQLPQYFFSDLHLAAPRLQTLKIGVELFSQWSPGWWQSLPALEQIVVGSRRDQAIVPGGAEPVALTLHDEFFDMLRTPRRVWRVKLWCPLQREMLVRLLVPSQPFPELRELTLNLSNADVLEEFKRPPVKSPREGKARKGGVGRATVQSVDDADKRTVFAALESLTLANVEQYPSLPAELIERVAARAPRLKFFSVVNTTRVPPPPPASKLRRRG